MPLKSRIPYSYINKDFLVFVIAITISLVILFSNKSPSVLKLKHQVIWVLGKLSSPIYWYKNLLIIKEKNKLLKDEVMRLTLLNSEMIGYHRENIRLKKLLNFKQKDSISYQIARVIKYQLGVTNHSFNIDIGFLESIEKNMPVLDENGLLGKTIYVEDNSAMIQVITDKNYRVSIRVGNERVLGIFMPTHGRFGILEGVRKTTPLLKGDIVYTSGISEIYPPNIPVAEVISTSQTLNDPFQTVIVKLLAELNDLDFIFVIL
tara:strand:- start:831 stop:1616 length:786 start_codon:yes stop_codon:yes gene_type:complete